MRCHLNLQAAEIFGVKFIFCSLHAVTSSVIYYIHAQGKSNLFVKLEVTIARKCCLKGQGNADILETSTNKL